MEGSAPPSSQYNATVDDSVASPKVGAPGKIPAITRDGAQSKEAGAAAPSEDLYDF